MRSVLTLSPLLQRSATTPNATSTHSPAVDVIERADDFVVRLDVPGFNRDQLTISVENETLEIRGERDTPESENETFVRRERRPSNGFIRTFRLGRQVDADNVSASHDNGVLEVRVAKAEAAKPRRIAVS